MKLNKVSPRSALLETVKHTKPLTALIPTTRMFQNYRIPYL